MSLEYLLQGLNYPCTIKWYSGTIDDEHFRDYEKYTFTAIDHLIATINEVQEKCPGLIITVTEFKKMSDLCYEIALG